MSPPDPRSLSLARAPALPVTVVTGFLGSGKTTLLRRLLTGGRAEDTAVIVNEWGEIGLDHHLIESAEEDTVLLSGGCLCCSLRGDLVETLLRLLERRYRGEVPAFRRVVVETSGLAAPLPILQSFMTDPLRLSRYRLGPMVALVDAVLGPQTLERHAVSRDQVALAERVVVSKTDLAGEAAVEGLMDLLAGLNPNATVLWSHPENATWDLLFSAQGDGHSISPRFLDARPSEIHSATGLGPRTFCITLQNPVDWPAFRSGLEGLIARHGEEILRLKGLVNARGSDGPMLINGAQHLFHRPEVLEAWPGGQRLTRLIFITRSLDKATVERELQVGLSGILPGTSPQPSGSDRGTIASASRPA